MTSRIFPHAIRALQVATNFDDHAGPTIHQYEIEAVFGAPDRTLIGFQVRVKDLDGFGVGYLNEAEEIER